MFRTRALARLAAASVAALAFAAAASSAGARPDPDGQAWWSHVERLAADDMQGRLTGSPGYYKAAAYVADAFKAAGLKPAGDKGTYFQSVPFTSQVVDQEASSASLSVGGHSQALRPGEDLVFGSRLVQPRSIRAPLVFIGYGLALPEAHYDDYAGQDLRGKIVVTIGGGPDTLSGALKAHSGAYARWKALEKAGVVGLISIPNPHSMDIPWPRLRLLAAQSGMFISDPKLQDYPGELLTATINPEHAAALFAASGHSFEEVLAASDAHKPIAGFDLHASLEAHVAAKVTHVDSPNVAGLLPGSDPALAAQYVVVTAHLDHLGVGAPIKGDPIYHGAMDNAAGVASLIETARSMTKAAAIAGGERPRRSILFVAVTAEEKGLLGSRYFASRPTVDPRAIVADINMDEFLPLYPLKTLTALGENESTLGDDLKAVASRFGYGLLPDAEPDRNLFVRSDQYSFIRTGVPSLALMFGHAPGTPEDDIVKAWNRDRYHSPQDNLSQPVDKEAASRFDEFLDALILKVADDPAAPRWRDDSFFKRFARE